VISFTSKNDKKEEKEEYTSIKSRIEQYDNLRIEVIKTIRKVKPNVTPQELVAFIGYLLSIFICAIIESAHDKNPMLNKETEALRLFSIVSTTIENAIKMEFETERLR
jgi:hypothetical protein